MRHTLEDNMAIEVPESYIRQQQKSLGISVQGACEFYAFDEGYLPCEEAEALGEKASPKKARPRKEDPIKREIMQELFTAVCRMDMEQEVENIELSHPERIVSFSLGGDTYTVTLSRKRKAK